ncbi:MAG: nitroreductase family protein [Candidatus Hodarchaeales archaeon]|jgi:nitroreductase
MEFSKVIQDRRSIRKYRPDAVSEEKLTRILDAARIAPTAANRQPFHLIVVKNPRRYLSDRVRQTWVLDAPIVVIAFCDSEKAWVRQWDSQDFSFVDTAIAMDHLILAATAEGLGTCWVAANDPAKLEELLPTELQMKFVALTPIGYPVAEPAEKSRKDLSELISTLT